MSTYRIFWLSFIFFSMISFGLQAIDLRGIKPKSFTVEVNVFEKEFFAGQLPPLSSFLVVSGIASADFPRYQKQYLALVKNFKKLSKKMNVYEKADQLLQFLHKNLFKKYQEKVTTLDRVFDEGIYNCVSSSVLYNLMAQDVGLEAQAARLSDHVLSQVKIKDRWLDAETTVAYGFDPGNRREAVDAFKKITGYVYVPSSKVGRKVHIISTMDLAALMYSNRGVNALEKKDYLNAAGFFWKAVWLLRDFDEGEQNLQAGYTDLAIVRVAEKKFEEAAKILSELSEFFPDSSKIKSNLKTVYESWLNYHFDQKKYREGIDLIGKHPSVFSKKDLKLYYELWIQDLMVKERNYLAALKVMEEAQGYFPGDRDLENNQDVIVQRYFLLALEKKDRKLQQEIFQKYQNRQLLVTFFALELSKAGQNKEAREYLTRELRRKVTEDRLNLLLQLTSTAIQKKDLTEAKAGITVLADFQDKSSTIKRYLPELLKQLSQYFYQQGKIEDGVTILLELSRDKKLEKQALEALGMLYYQGKIYPLLKNKEFDKALPLLKKGMKLSRGYYPPLQEEFKNSRINIGAQYYQEKNYKKAFYYYIELQKEFPRDRNILNNLQASAQMYLKMLPEKSGEVSRVKKLLEEIVR